MGENNENESIVVPDVVVNVDNVHIASEQFAVIEAGVQQVTEGLETLNKSFVHATSFLILLCVFQFYGLLRRASKKGGA